MVGINQVLDGFFKQQGNWKCYLMANWRTIMGPIALHTCIEKIDHDTLVIGVCDSVWMQELFTLSQVILNKINHTLEHPYLKKIRFKMTTQKKCSHKSLCKNTYFQYPKHQLTIKEKQALQSIPDQELSIALEQFLMRCYEVKHL